MERIVTMHLTDIHCHLLPGVDDGPGTIKEAGRLLDLMREEGVDRIIVTPHFHPEMFEPSAERVERFYWGLREMARRRRIRLYLGCEFYRCPEMSRLLAEGKDHLWQVLHMCLWSSLRTMCIRRSEIIYTSFDPGGGGRSSPMWRGMNAATGTAGESES